MLRLSIIGTSKIVEEHIKVAKATGFELFSISSTRKNSFNLKKLKKKYNFKYSFSNWKDAVNHSTKYKGTIFLIAPRIQDTYKILTKILKKKKYVFVEKPLTTKISEFNNILSHNNNIFVGYNRMFYKNIIYLKTKLKKPDNVIIKCPETSKKNILLNSVHVISVLFFLFGELRILDKKKYKNSLFVYLKSKQNIPIYLFFNFNASENFSIEFYDKNQRFLLKPLENLYVYKGMQVKKNSSNKNLLDYVPRVKYYKSEMSFNKFKPGFLNQMNAFKKFLKNKGKIQNNLIFAKKTMLLAKKILY